MIQTDRFSDKIAWHCNSIGKRIARTNDDQCTCWSRDARGGVKFCCSLKINYSQ